MSVLFEGTNGRVLTDVPSTRHDTTGAKFEYSQRDRIHRLERGVRLRNYLENWTRFHMTGLNTTRGASGNFDRAFCYANTRPEFLDARVLKRSRC